MVAVCPICDIAECAHIREPKLKARISDLEARLADNQTVIDASDDLTAAYLAGYGAAQKRTNELAVALAVAQKALATVTAPSRDNSGTAILTAWAICVEAEAKARAALKGR